MMSRTGFCRNCLGKWLTKHARGMVRGGQVNREDAERLNDMTLEDFLTNVYKEVRVKGSVKARVEEGRHKGKARSDRMYVYTV